ncbi:MAG: RluA family pseudouridine synthase, partial [Bacteroidales bacterium]|nr:RluA family pseudouridine synthase [Bacteroidales bacterium]
MYRGSLPETFNNPFDYVPHPVCEAAVRDLLPRVEELMCGNPEGKMFGVLVVLKEEKLYYLAAFSGQLYDKSVMPGFVPPVFDFLDPDGYFKRHEAEISEINHKISELQSDSRYFEFRKAYQQLQKDAELSIEEAKRTMQVAKEKRVIERTRRQLTVEEETAFVKESQFLKAEVRRVKKRWEETLTAARQELEA